MTIDDFGFDQDHPVGDSATHPTKESRMMGRMPIGRSCASNKTIRRSVCAHNGVLTFLG